MSNSVTNVEIEDILSSIRRLVSEDSPPRPNAPVARREAKRVDRLVLTPALRVKDPDPEARPAAKTGPVLLTNPAPPKPSVASETSPKPSLLTQLVEEEVTRALATDDEAEDRSDGADDAPAGDDILHLSSPVSSKRHDANPPEHGAEVTDLQSVLSQLKAETDEHSAELSEESAPDGVFDDESSADDELDLTAALAAFDDDAAGPETAEPDTELERKISALEALVRGRDKQLAQIMDDTGRGDAEEPVAQGSDSLASETPEVIADTAEGHETDLMDDNSHDSASEMPEEDDALTASAPSLADEIATAPEPQNDLAKRLTASQEPAAEASKPEDSDTVRPVFRRRATAEPRVIEWEDHTAGPTGALPQSEPEADISTQQAYSRDLSDEQDRNAPILDEAMLREMVSDIVRQELQGVLGERITRNVRKLVRREIHRVMMTQDFD
ncbi:hypothetical protein GGQ68_000995 [Sagittula marina]|uniref:Uncharacterized protein n=1 Tax=Sagittula marina TaxID=943940 RepID=A0A7W6GT08_9RHOB|nr:hypothetical protein [Sagittula marina]MBB3984679.1 hypothetical protein [Sagittula marina]